MIADQTAQDYGNARASIIELRPANSVRARYLRLTGTRLRAFEGKACLALSQIEIRSGAANIAVGAKVTASDSIEQAPWSAAAVVDGLGVPGTNPRANSTLLLRREFSVRPGLRRAIAHVSGLGHYEMSVNGTPLRTHYGVMQRYLAYLVSKADRHILSYGLGDWYDLGPDRPGLAQLTPIALTATAIYYEDTRALARIAEHLGKADDARRYTGEAEQIKAAFNQKFFDPAKATYATGSQTANAMPLVLDLVPSEHRAAVLDAIVRDVRERGSSITSGDVGYRYLLRALAGGGRSDVIYKMSHQSEKPGYGYQLKMGATSLTEAWNADRRSSQNHFMLGQLMEWFYHELAGIAPDPAGPGFRKIIIKPQPVGDITWAKASYDSVRGRIVSDWKRAGEKFTLEITIPANTTATVYVPAIAAEQVTERGTPAGRSREARPLRYESGWAVFRISSGRYIFESRLHNN